jgi:hypothetical protein
LHFFSNIIPGPMILHFSLGTTTCLFHHFKRTPSSSIGDPSAYCIMRNHKGI